MSYIPYSSAPLASARAKLNPSLNMLLAPGESTRHMWKTLQLEADSPPRQYVLSIVHQRGVLLKLAFGADHRLVVTPNCSRHHQALMLNQSERPTCGSCIDPDELISYDTGLELFSMDYDCPELRAEEAGAEGNIWGVYRRRAKLSPGDQARLLMEIIPLSKENVLERELAAQRFSEELQALQTLWCGALTDGLTP